MEVNPDAMRIAEQLDRERARGIIRGKAVIAIVADMNGS
jgi:hypothetical protein